MIELSAGVTSFLHKYIATEDASTDTSKSVLP